MATGKSQQIKEQTSISLNGIIKLAVGCWFGWMASV
uniref:Uncharacterized protein n=1 Tax=Arundo donax TaxID=35708 RepID=A0A0A8YKU1_ARUDO